MMSDNPNSGIYEASSARTLDHNGGNPACNQGGTLVYDARGNGDGQTVPTMTGDHQNRVTDYSAIVISDNGGETAFDVSVTLKSRDSKAASVVWWDGEKTAQTLTRNLANQRMPDSGSLFALCDRKLVRRLTPTECERLQGFPDGWTDIGIWEDEHGKKCKTTDSNRYKALGNSIALPYWKHLVKKISAVYERDATMASLFDGIGGFPLLWEQINGKGGVKWISEIEPFCCALTERRFG